MDQPKTQPNATTPPPAAATANGGGQAPSENRGWRGALAGVFGRGGGSQTETPSTTPAQAPAAPADTAPRTATTASDATKLATKAEALRQICHLIRTPLGGVVGMADLVSGSGLPPAQLPYLAIIRDSVAEALSILDDLSELAQDDRKFAEPVSRSFAASQVLDTLAAEFKPHCEAKQLKLTCKNETAPGTKLEGDVARFSQIARRVLRIAVRHNERAPLELSISVTGRNTGAPAGGNATAVTAQMTIGDFQIGLPSERADRILRSTPRADEMWAEDGQTGLSLRACRAAIESLGGTLAVANAGNGLSRVLISVPMKMSSGHQDAAAVVQAAAATHGKKRPSDEPSLIDVDALVTRCVSNKAVAAAVLESLARMLPEKLAGLREAVDASDAEKARTIAHTIKGSAANAAVEAVRSKALQIELMAKAADIDGITGVLPALEKVIAQVLAQIPATRASLTAPGTKAAA